MGEYGTVVDGKEEKRVSLWGARVKRRRRKGNGGWVSRRRRKGNDGSPARRREIGRRTKEGWPGSGEIKMRREKGEFFGNGRLIEKEIEERG